MTAAIPRLRIAGAPVDCISFDHTVGELCRRIDLRERTHVLFINAAKVVKYAAGELRAVIDRADLLLADGVPVVWASRLLRRPLPGRVNGTDLMERMVAVAADRGYRVFFLGGTQSVIQRAVAEFQRRHPRLCVAGFRNGYFGDTEDDAVIAQINRSHPDLLLLGMSTPKKEIWADGNLLRLDVAVCQGVGGSFDVVAGLTRRAPRFMQVYGLEWFYRLLQEPRRMWRRYLVTNTLFVWLVLRDLVHTFTGSRHRSSDGAARN